MAHKILRAHPSWEEKNEIPVAVLGGQEIIGKAAKPQGQVGRDGGLRAEAQPGWSNDGREHSIPPLFLSGEEPLRGRDKDLHTRGPETHSPIHGWKRRRPTVVAFGKVTRAKTGKALWRISTPVAPVVLRKAPEATPFPPCSVQRNRGGGGGTTDAQVKIAGSTTLGVQGLPKECIFKGLA